MPNKIKHNYESIINHLRNYPETRQFILNYIVFWIELSSDPDGCDPMGLLLSNYNVYVYLIYIGLKWLINN